jgi:hypothetical protein
MFPRPQPSQHRVAYFSSCRVGNWLGWVAALDRVEGQDVRSRNPQGGVDVTTVALMELSCLVLRT